MTCMYILDGLSTNYDETLDDSEIEWQSCAEDFYMVDGLVDGRWDKAKFLLRVTEENNLTHFGVDSLCDSVQWLVDSITCDIKEKIKTEIPESVTEEQKSDILNACNPGDIFFGLKSRYLREKYYDNFFKYVVSVYMHECSYHANHRECKCMTVCISACGSAII